MDAAAFDRIISSAPTSEDRLSWFGALLARESGTPVEIVGGSAIEIYLSSAIYVSQDVDLVGRKDSLARVLRRWKFRQVKGRSQRIYWLKSAIGLVDIVGPGDRSGLSPRRMKTPYGDVLLSAVEPLILTRLSRFAREHSDGLYRQAVRLAKGRPLDWDYLEAMARFEGISTLVGRLRKSAQG